MADRESEKNPNLAEIDFLPKGRRLKNVFRDVFAIGGMGGQLEADLFADLLHGMVVGHDFGVQAGEFFVPSNLHQASEQFGAESLFLPVVVDEQGKLAFIQAVFLA
jgi:hypothetical protein